MWTFFEAIISVAGFHYNRSVAFVDTSKPSVWPGYTLTYKLKVKAEINQIMQLLPKSTGDKIGPE